MKADPLSEQDLEIGPVVSGALDAPDASLDAIEADIRRLIKELAESRFAADQAAREHKDFTRQLFLELLEVLDAFDRIFADVRRRPEHLTPPVRIWMGNFRTVRRLVDIALRDRGVSRIEKVSGEFDPYWHRATKTIADASGADGTIVEETQAGYTWRNELLRKTEVVVVRTAPEPQRSGE